MKQIILRAIWFVLLSSCATPTYQYASNLKLLGFDTSSANGKTLGRLNNQICERASGFELGQPPFLAAMKAASNGADVGFYRFVTTDQRISQAEFLAQNCLVFMGDAYP